jgi:Dolichyl-phosphate-mannose-protein mannosyltransferase
MVVCGPERLPSAAQSRTVWMTGLTPYARTFAAGFIAILLLGASLRFLFPTADPPWRTTVGVVWHDEGAWTHNARNRALFGAWRLDQWNPMFVSPVFTALEYAAFGTLGVGTWQARTVSQAAGMLAVLLIGLGVARVGGRQAGHAAGVIAAAWLATNYVYVMYDRAALMESTMAAFVVAGWYGFVRAQERPVWGLWAGSAAILAYFTKAAAVFFIAALVIASAWSLVEGCPHPSPLPARRGRERGSEDRRRLQFGRLFRWSTYRLTSTSPDDAARIGAVWTLIGLAVAGLLALAVFVIPFWTDYRFYNWPMSVTRKPSYDLRSLLDRVTWLPILHDVFTRMWFVWVVGLIAWIGSLVRATELGAPERLLTLWVGIGGLELIAHDVGNERRFVFLIPALIAIASLALARDRRLLPPATASISRPKALLAMPVVLYLSYLLIGALVRLASLYDVGPNVRLAAALAVAMTALVYLTWPRVPRWIAGAQITMRAAAVIALLVVAGNLIQFTQWAVDRTYANYEASRELGRLLPPGTLVHGKLANGLALENGIRPIFVGRNFGNYADRLTRNDVPYVLTYVAPRLGYEGAVILDVLQAYPQRRILWTFDVRESVGGHDRAALIAKGPPAVAGPELRTDTASVGSRSRNGLAGW